VILLLLFIQFIPAEKGIVFYKSSRVYFKTLEQTIYLVKSWETLETPTDQVIEVSYELKDKQVYNLKMTKSFQLIYQKSNRIMKAGEKLLKQRKFSQSLDSLLIVQKLNPFIPYLYSNLFYALSQLNKDTDAMQLIDLFEEKRIFLSDLEQSVFYYDLYDYWRNRFDKNKNIINLDKALKALQDSYALKKDPDKLRIISSLRSKYEALGNDQ